MQMKLGTRLGLLHAVTVLSLLCVLTIVGLAIHEAGKQNAMVHESHIPSLEMTNSLLLRLDAMEREEFLYFAPGQDPQAHMQRFDEQAQAFEALYLDLRAVSQNPAERQLYAAIGHAYGRYRQLDAEMRELVAAGRLTEARQMNATESLAFVQDLREAATELHDLNLREAEAARQAARDAIGRSGLGAMGVVLISVLVSALLWYRTTKDVVAPLRELHEATASLARGSYRPAVSTSAIRTVEITALQNEFNAMAHRLAETTEALVTANTTLETQVAERTQALEEAKARLEAMVAELRTVDKLKSDFMTIMSHELLTPINFITGYGSALEDGVMGPLTAEQARAVGRMMEGAERLTRMVRNVLDYTQLEAHRLAIHPEPVAVAEVIEAVADRLRPASERKYQRLELDVPADLPDAWADPDRLAQLVTELVDNAIKFSSEGRSIRLVAAERPEALLIEVADTGDGIPAEALDNLFKPFYQVESGATRRHGGMGLGLAIAHQLAAHMGGELTVKTRLGQGSTFRVALPRADRAMVGAPPIQV